MKRLIQLGLLIFVVLISLIFYKSYFIDNKTSESINLNQSKNSTLENQNNLIKNLEYNVTLNDNSKYLITASESELSYLEGVEIVFMKNVTAQFFDSDEAVLTITSDEAIFNNTIYDTQFRKNVKITYLENLILSEKLDLNLSKNNAIIFDNVVYRGLQGNILTDNIFIDLITKNVDIYMNDKKDNVIVNAN
mgnify:CR=1 FL=1